MNRQHRFWNETISRMCLAAMLMLSAWSINAVAQEEKSDNGRDWSSGKPKISLKVKKSIDGDTDVDEFTVEHPESVDVMRIVLNSEICNLQMELRNREQQSITCQLEWYFITEHTRLYDTNVESEPDPETVIFDSGKKTITVDGGETIKESVLSNPIVFKDTNGIAFEGDVFEGYVVLMTVSGQIIAQEGKPSRYLKDEWIQKLRSYKPDTGN